MCTVHNALCIRLDAAEYCTMGLSSSAILPPLLFVLTASEFKSCNNVSSMQCTQYLYIVASGKVIEPKTEILVRFISRAHFKANGRQSALQNKNRQQTTDETFKHSESRRIKRTDVLTRFSSRDYYCTVLLEHQALMFSDECFLSCSSAPCPWCPSASSPSLTATTCL